MLDYEGRRDAETVEAPDPWADDEKARKFEADREAAKLVEKQEVQKREAEIPGLIAGEEQAKVQAQAMAEEIKAGKYSPEEAVPERIKSAELDPALQKYAGTYNEIFAKHQKLTEEIRALKQAKAPREALSAKVEESNRTLNAITNGYIEAVAINNQGKSVKTRKYFIDLPSTKAGESAGEANERGEEEYRRQVFHDPNLLLEYAEQDPVRIDQEISPRLTETQSPLLQDPDFLKKLEALKL